MERTSSNQGNGLLSIMPWKRISESVLTFILSIFQALEQTGFYARSLIPSPTHAVPRCLPVNIYTGSR